MSASIPNQIKKLLGVQNYPLITQKKLFEKKANEIIKVNDSLDDDFYLILEKFKEGKDVLVIRNTVKSATQTYSELLELGIEVEDIVLYHSTFKKGDRTKKEELIFQKLKEKKPFILVATQIVEVSLDIDFDVMFTDNAPIDSLIQRFGRVNRKKSVEKKGEIYIYQVENPLPYGETILDLTFETIEEGYFELGEYVKWLNIVYDRWFEEDITVKNEITRLFDIGYEKHDETIKRLDGIKKSSDNYDLRDIEESKNDYILYDDYTNDNMDYEYTVALPYYLERKFKHTLPSEAEERLYYPILKLDYSFEKGVDIPKNDESSGSYFC